MTLPLHILYSGLSGHGRRGREEEIQCKYQ